MSEALEMTRCLSQEDKAAPTACKPAQTVRDVATSPITRRPQGAPVPLSVSQQQIWLHTQLAPDAPLYNEVLILDHTGSLELEAVEKSWREITHRHEILRTRFPVVDGSPVQIGGDEPGELRVTDPGTLVDGEGETKVLEIAEEEVRRPFSVAEDSLVRARLVRMPHERCVLIVAFHALIADEESVEIFTREFRSLYRAYSTGEPHLLPELPLQYPDYAWWQRRYLTGDVLDEHIAYWRGRLAGCPPALELLTDRTRPPVQRFHGARRRFELSQYLTESLRRLSEEEGVTLATTLCAGFQMMLSRYTGQADIVIGSIVRERARRETQGLIGPLSQTVITRCDLEGDPSVLDVIGRVDRAAVLDCEHQHVPLDRLVSELQPGFDPSRNTFFQVLFSVAPVASHEEWDWQTAQLEVDSGAAKVDLQLQIYEESDRLSGRFTFNTDLFQAATIDRMTRHLQTLLEGAVGDRNRPLSRLPLLTQPEQYQLIVEWNDTYADYPHDCCVHHLFELQVKRTPNATAVVCEGKQLTYRELNTRANQVAHRLRSLGAGPHVLVAICSERSLEMVVGLLGILKAGAAYVPLDPAYPRDRLSFMLEDAEVAVLLTQASLAGHLPQTGARVVCLDRDWQEMAAESTADLVSDVEPENLAYVIYTSGSTGKPKGVQIPHRAVVNFLISMSQKPGLGDEDRLLAVTTLCFDIAGLEIYLPLVVGASLEIASREIVSDGRRLIDKLTSSRATIMQATPATWRMLLEAGWEGDSRLKALCGGEALPRSLANQLLQRTGSLWNMYGPTETTIWSSVSKVEPGEDALTIGKPIANTEFFVLDNLLQPTPIGVAGELHIGGVGLARGYLKRPELTAQKFISHPLSPDPEARLYKTGDMARYLPSGEIEFRGRIDHQVKIRGFRIELGEIEAELRRHAGVSDAVVVAQEDRAGGQRLMAYFVPAQNPVPSVSEWRSFMKEKLPEHMIPSAFVALAALPLTPNGKVDRRALPNPEELPLTPDQEFAEARDGLEAQLVKIWENALGVRPIGIRHNFFEIGGHSLIAVKLTHQIGQTLGKNLPVVTLFEAPTIEQLAVILRQDGWSSPWSSLVPIQSAGSKPPFFCVHGALGTVIRFRNLSRHLGAEQPFYALQPLGLDPRRPCHTRVEDMATHYLKEVRLIQPVGPYYFGGYSLGGLIALEMAQQLVAEGQEPAWVGLFDTFCPSVPESQRASKTAGLLWGWVTSGLLAFVRCTNEERRRHVSRIGRTLVQGLKRRLHGLGLPARLKTVSRACRQAAEMYEPRPYAGPMFLFRSRYKPLTQFRNPHVGWTKYALRGIEIREIDGDHDSVLLEPQVRLVAEELAACLQNARQEKHN